MPESREEHPDLFSIVALMAFAGPASFCWVALFMLFGVGWPLSLIIGWPDWLVPTLTVISAIVAVCTAVWLSFLKVRERRKMELRLTWGKITRKGVAKWLALGVWLLMLALFSYIGFLCSRFEGIGY